MLDSRTSRVLPVQLVGLVGLVGLTLCAAPRIAAAQPEPTDEARQEASERFRRALELFDEGNMEAALIEFEAAYERVPSWQVLYNIGACHRALGHPVEAVDAWDRYLSEGGDEVPPERREEVAAALAQQRARIGTVLVRTNVEDGRITVDGVAVADAPMAEPLRLAVGTYEIGVQAAGWEGPVRRVTVAGESEQILDVLLERVVTERGSLAIESPVPDAEVTVDGEPVGTTPLEETVPVSPGHHVVEVRRTGFETFRREVDVDAGQRTQVTVEMPLAVDTAPAARGELALALPPALYDLRVNGEPVEPGGGRVSLPAGRHHLVLEVEERVPHRQTVTVEAGSTVQLEPPLRWTDGARASRLNDAERLRIAGGVVLAGGLTGLAIGAVFVGVGEGYFAAEMDELFDDYDLCTNTGMLCDREAMDNAQRYLDVDATRRAFRWVYGIAFSAGAVASVIGVVMLSLAPSEESIDAAARAGLRLDVGPGGLFLRGRF
ncbi:MAG TPA: PEGA domain-containing protein [Sandaracinaceae bacterium LLY-WYZ-13_1]|nr:PEGA domain-containing protein [Sandaracinaceae bacterium LLY-WYZ-13_1]